MGDRVFSVEIEPKTGRISSSVMVASSLGCGLRRAMLRAANWQKRLKVASQMIEAVRGDFRAVLGLGENERALKDSL